MEMNKEGRRKTADFEREKRKKKKESLENLGFRLGKMQIAAEAAWPVPTLFFFFLLRRVSGRYVDSRVP